MSAVSSPDPASLAHEPPLCVDLDGTLSPCDSLHETLLALLRQDPLALAALPAALLRGRAAFKAEVLDRLCAAQTDFADRYAAQLPLHESFLQWLQQQHAAGRRLILVTAADARIAQAVARRLNLFEAVIASDGQHNLRGAAKRDALVARYGERGFDYAGNSATDRPIWAAARSAITVGAARRQIAALRRAGTPTQSFPAAAGRRRALWQALRPHQWLKNLLIFVPMLLAHRLGDPATLQATVLAFIAFCLCASSVYVQNDLVDLQADRQHPRKRQRPFARGALSAAQGLALACVLLLAATTLAWHVRFAFFGMLLLYLLTTGAYSLVLKKQPLLDITVLASLYTMRLIAGGLAARVVPSFWLFAFSLFMFASLGIVKRYAEFRNQAPGDDSGLRQRGYTAADAPVLMALGAASGFVAVLVLALYVNSPDALRLYRHPALLTLLCPLTMYWIGRVWLITGRGGMDDDPVVFALRDRVSRIIALLGALSVWCAM